MVQLRPQVNPLPAIESIVNRFAAWARRVGETRVAYAVLALAFALAAVLILAWGKGQTFINDEWNYLVVFRGWNLEVLLHPQNGHLVAFPLILYKAMFSTVGASSHLPYQAVTVVLHLLVATLFFLLVRGRAVLPVAVALTVLVAFFGAGWDTVMGAYEVPNLLGMATGLGMLLALEKRTRGGDLLACALLVVCLGSFSVGIAFALGALLAILLGGRTEWRRAWIILLPGLLYVAWFLWARKFGQTEVTLASISSIFNGIADQLAAICAGITGLFRVPGTIGLPTALEHRSDWGYPLALVLVALIALHIRRAPRSIHFWMLIGTLFFYLALVAVGLDPARTPQASRYVYMGSIITLLVVVELARDVKWSTAIGLVAVVIFGLSLMSNASTLRAGGRLFQAEGETNRATLAALELDRQHVNDGLSTESVETTTHSHADMLFPIWAYFQLADEQGSPAFSLDELLATGSQAREAADQELVNALEIEAEPVTRPSLDRGGAPLGPMSEGSGRARALGSCLALIPDLGRTATFRLELPPGGFSYRAAPGTAVTVKLGRFGAPVTELPAVTGSAEVAIPVDDVPVPWQAELRSDARLLACPR
jgi:hypothetical protein